MKRKLDIIIKLSGTKIVIPKKNLDAAKEIREWCIKNRGGNIRLQLSPPVKKRTTGEGSQNHHINAHVTSIANFTGEDFAVIKMEAKNRAIKRGYPYRTDMFGNVEPWSETELDTVQAGYLIDELHQIAAEYCAPIVESGEFEGVLN